MRSALEAAGDQSIPPPSSSLRWSSHLPSSIPPLPAASTTKSPSPMETSEFRLNQEPSGLEPGPSSSSPCGAPEKSPPRETTHAPTNTTIREMQHDMFNDGDDSQPSTSRAHSDFVDDAIPTKLLKPKLEPLDEESSRDGFTPLDSLAHIKTEGGLCRLSELRSEDSRSEASNVESKRYRVFFKVGSKAASRLKRILNAQPMALKRLGIAGVQVEPSGGMVSVTARAKERAAEEASRRPEPVHPGSVPTPSLPLPPQQQMRGVPDRNGDMAAMGSAHPGFPPQTGPPHGHIGMHPGQMGPAPGHINIQQPQMGDGSSGSGGAQISAMPPSALPPHMQQQRQSQPPPTSSPILVNLLNSQQPPPSVASRPFSPYTPGYPGGPPSAVAGVPPSAQAQPGQPIDMAAYHQQMQERQRLMIQQQQQQQQIQGVVAPTTPASGPGPSGYVYPQRQMFATQQPGMYPPGHPNAQQRVPYPGQPAVYGAMPQVKQESITSGYSAMPQVKQEPVETAPPPAKKRKKPTKKQQQKEAEAQAAAQAQQAAVQPGPYFADGRMMHPQQMQGGFPGGAQFHPTAGGPPPGMHHPQYYQQQQWQQLQQQRMMQQAQHQQQQQQHQQQQQQMGITPDYPPGTHPAPPPGPSPSSWHPHQRPPPVPYPPGQNDGAAGGVGAVTGTGDMGSHSESNSPVTPYGGHPIMLQQQAGHPSPYGRESGEGTPTLFPYPSTPHGGPGPSGQSGLNSNPITPGTTPQTPGGQQGQPTISNDHHDFDDKLLGEGTLDDLNLGDLDDIVPMGDLATMTRVGDGGQSQGDGRVKEELVEENGEGASGGSTNNPIKRNGRHDLDMSINSVVDMVAKGGGELSSPTPPSTATPTGGGGSGASAFPATTPVSNTSSTAPPTPTLQAAPSPAVRRKNTASSVQQLAAQQRMHQMQGTPFGMPSVGGCAPGGIHQMHGHPPHQMGHGPPHGHHIVHQQPPNNAPSGYPMDHHGRTLLPSYHQTSRGGRVTGTIENGRINGHQELSNGNSSREDTGAEAQIQAILSKVKAQELSRTQEQQRAREKLPNSGAKSRGGGTGARKKKKVTDMAKERSPKLEEDTIYIGLDGVRGPPTMTAGQAAKARMGVGQGGGNIPPGTFYHQISSQNLPMRPQPPPVQHKPA